jgi:hypothetical protein
MDEGLKGFLVGVHELPVGHEVYSRDGPLVSVAINVGEPLSFEYRFDGGVSDDSGVDEYGYAGRR